MGERENFVFYLKGFDSSSLCSWGAHETTTTSRSRTRLSARLTSWRVTAARTVRVCAHLPRAFMHPGLGACVPCGASCSGGPALAYPISGGGASCHRPVPAASRFWARRDARPKGGVLGRAGGRTKQQGWLAVRPSRPQRQWA